VSISDCTKLYRMFMCSVSSVSASISAFSVASISTHTHIIMRAFYEVFQCVYEGVFYGVFTMLSTVFVGIMGRSYRVFTRWNRFAETKVVVWNGRHLVNTVERSTCLVDRRGCEQFTYDCYPTASRLRLNCVDLTPPGEYG